MREILKADPSFKERLNELKDTQDEEEKYKEYQKLTKEYCDKLDEDAKKEVYARLHKELEESTEEDQKSIRKTNEKTQEINQESKKDEDSASDGPIIFYQEIVIGKQKAYAVKRIEDTVPGFYQLLKEHKLKAGETLTQYLDREKLKDAAFCEKAFQAVDDLTLAGYSEGIRIKTPRSFDAKKPENGSEKIPPSKLNYRTIFLQSTASAKLDKPDCADNDYEYFAGHLLTTVGDIITDPDVSLPELIAQIKKFVFDTGMDEELIQEIQNVKQADRSLISKKISQNESFRSLTDFQVKRLNAAKAAKEQADANKKQAEADQQAARKTEAQAEAEKTEAGKKVSDATKPIEEAQNPANKADPTAENAKQAEEKILADDQALKNPEGEKLLDRAPEPIPAPGNPLATNEAEEEDDEEEGDRQEPPLPKTPEEDHSPIDHNVHQQNSISPAVDPELEAGNRIMLRQAQEDLNPLESSELAASMHPSRAVQVPSVHSSHQNVATDTHTNNVSLGGSEDE